ncbi:hypothetical protein JOQ06_016312, partial [Pogonophryne albipinna]
RSSGTLPPVGGAQQSQVAVGGTAEEEGAATGQQSASVCPKTGWKKRGQVKSKWFLPVAAALESSSHTGRLACSNLRQTLSPDHLEVISPAEPVKAQSRSYVYNSLSPSHIPLVSQLQRR